MRRIDFARFTAEVLCLYEPPIRAKGTWRQMRQVLIEFAALPDMATTADLTPLAISRWIKAFPARSPARAASLLRSLSPACAYAKSQGYLRSSPFDWRKLKHWVLSEVEAPDSPRPDRHQSAEAIGRLLSTLDREADAGDWKRCRLRAFVYLLAYTGLRKNEALHLKPWDVNTLTGEVRIERRRSFRPKTRKSAARIPLASRANEVMRAWVPLCGESWLFPGVRLKAPWLGGCPGYKPLDEVRAAGERAGIEGLTIDSFRKTIGTLAKFWGLNQLEVKALLRHTTTETQKFYDEETVESLRPGVSKIYFPSPPAVPATITIPAVSSVA
jgi:integrase